MRVDDLKQNRRDWISFLHGTINNKWREGKNNNHNIGYYLMNIYIKCIIINYCCIE